MAYRDFVATEWFALSECLKNQTCYGPRAHMVKSVPFWEIKSRNTLTTQRSGEYILMGINYSVNAMTAKSINYILNLIKVIKVVNSWLLFNCFPDHAKTDYISAPFLQQQNIVLCQTHYSIKFVVCW